LEFGVLGFVEGRKPENPEKNPRSKEDNQQQTQSPYDTGLFVEGGKPENPEKNPQSKEENQQQTQPTYDIGLELNPGHIGGRRALSPLHHPCSPRNER